MTPKLIYILNQVQRRRRRPLLVRFGTTRVHISAGFDFLDFCVGNVPVIHARYVSLNWVKDLLLTSEPFVGGVTFQAKNGTMGLPYYAMDHFHNQVQTTKFDEERRSYCLPVLDPHIISCTEEPIELGQMQTNSSLVKYTRLTANSANATDVLVNDMYEISIPYPAHPENIKYRIADQGHGTMLARMYPDPDLYNTTVITASDETNAEPNGMLFEASGGERYFAICS
jgi:hypothetical protein